MDVLQGVPQDITALIKQNPKITREELAAQSTRVVLLL